MFPNEDNINITNTYHLRHRYIYCCFMRYMNIKWWWTVALNEDFNDCTEKCGIVLELMNCFFFVNCAKTKQNQSKFCFHFIWHHMYHTAHSDVLFTFTQTHNAHEAPSPWQLLGLSLKTATSLSPTHLLNTPVWRSRPGLFLWENWQQI